MGAWGYGPFESDQALDWVGSEVTDGVLATLQSSLDFDPDGIDLAPASQVQAAIFVFVSLLGHPSRVLDISEKTAVDFARKGLVALDVLNRSEWVAEWDNSVAYRAANQELIDALNKVVEDPSVAVVGTTLMGKILSGEAERVPEVGAEWFDTRTGLRGKILADEPERGEVRVEALDGMGGRATMSRSAFLHWWRPRAARPTLEDIMGDG